jgi:hypothetical protein
MTREQRYEQVMAALAASPEGLSVDNIYSATGMSYDEARDVAHDLFLAGHVHYGKAPRRIASPWVVSGKAPLTAQQEGK